MQHRPEVDPSTSVLRWEWLTRRVLDQPKGFLVLLQAPPGYGKSLFLAELHGELERRDPRTTLWISADQWMSAAAGRDGLTSVPPGSHALVDFQDATPDPDSFIGVASRLLARNITVVAAFRAPSLAQRASASFPGRCLWLSETQMRMRLGQVAALFGLSELDPAAADLQQFTSGWLAGLHLIRSVTPEAGAGVGPLALSGERLLPVDDYFQRILPTLMSEVELAILQDIVRLGVSSIASVELVSPEGVYLRALSALVARGAFLSQALTPEPRFVIQPILRRHLRRHRLAAGFNDFASSGDARALANRGHVRAGLAMAARAGPPALVAEVIESLGGLRVALTIGGAAAEYFEIASTRELRSHPEIVMGSIYCMLQQGRTRLARDVFDRYAAQAGPAGQTVSFELLRGVIRFYESDHIDQADVDQIRLKLEDTPGGVNDVTLFLFYQLMVSVSCENRRLEEAYHHSRRSMEIALTNQSPIMVRYAKLYMAFVQVRLGNHAKAEEVLRSLISVADEQLAPDDPELAAVMVLLAWLFVEKLDFEGAQQILLEYDDEIDLYTGWRDAAETALQTAAILTLELSGLDTAIQFLDRKQRTFANDARRSMAEYAGALKAGLFLRHAQPDQAAVELNQIPSRDSIAPSAPAEPDSDLLVRLARLRLRLERGSLPEAHELEAVGAAVKASGDVYLAFDLSVLTALAAVSAGEPATAGVQRAVRIAARHGLKATLRAELRALRPLIDERARAGLTAHELQFLEGLGDLASVREKVGKSINGPRLSRREEQILNYLSLGFSSKEMAAALNLSIGTVKGYRRSLYEKLGIFRRSEAVAFIQSRHTDDAETG